MAENGRGLDIISVTEAKTLDGLFAERVRRTPNAAGYREYDEAEGRWRDHTWQDIHQQVARWPVEQVEASLAAGVIGAEEAATLERAARLRRKAIMVDDFPRDLGRSELHQTTEPVSFEPLRRAFETVQEGSARGS